jgi:hypothetical protein
MVVDGDGPFSASKGWAMVVDGDGPFSALFSEVVRTKWNGDDDSIANYFD